MHNKSDHITLLAPAAGRPSSGGLSGSLPPDLLEQVRKRVGLLALLLAMAFAFDPLFYYVVTLLHALGTGGALVLAPHTAIFANVSGVAALASLALWRAARSPRIPPGTLHTLGLIYEVAICLTMGLLAYWQYYLQFHLLPNLSWIPAVVIFFPMLLPGPPRRMLAAAIVSGAMAPISILLLDLLGVIPFLVALEGYLPAIIGSTFAVIFAWMGAKVIYGLGREVAAARELGSYQLEERLGQGGMGEVWKARHRLLARPAAIKLIRPTLTASPEVLRRFEREAQAIAALRSPHTVTLFDFGVSSDGAFYYVMELLEGLDADRLVRLHGAQPAERVMHVLWQICHSLSEAESRGLVHRDIKPANIFLCRYGLEYDFVKVLDFGIVKTLGEPAESTPGLTRDNTIPGSPHFMAPEQALGETGVDGRADIYAVGCVAYWLLTGTTLFAGDSPIAQLMHQANTAPSPPSTRTDNPIPAPLEQLVMECLAKSPDARPQSARALAGRLALIEGGAVWRVERAPLWWQEHFPETPSSSRP